MFGRILLALTIIGVAGLAALTWGRPTRRDRVEAWLPPKPPPRLISDQGWAPIAERGHALRSEVLGGPFEVLKPLWKPKGRPDVDGWLAAHSEPGQSLVDWRASDPPRVTGARRTIYLQPVGDFTSDQADVLALTADYVSRFLGVPVKTLPTWRAGEIFDTARRRNPWSGQPQLYTGYVLERLLYNRPEDALAYLALTAEDLFPGSDWNFVFGQASLEERVGVWSVHRFGDPAESEEAKRLFVRRTLATATHELLHMVGIHHCVAYECLANGINHQDEADAAPLEVCPQDLAKLVEATGVDPLSRYDRLIEFWAERDEVLHAELRRARTIFAEASSR